MPSSDKDLETLLCTIERQARLNGRFEQIKRLGDDGGDGSFSLVVTAADRVTNKRVALKFFHPGHHRNEYRWKAFLRESEILERLVGEKDILQFVAQRDEFSVPFEHGGMTLSIPFAYYAMELASGDVSQEILADRWTPQQKLEGFRAMCRAVQRIHARGMVHRDLKPSNFLTMPDGSLRLSDFGAARDLSDPSGAISTAYQAPPGDRRYTAPELIAALMMSILGYHFAQTYILLGQYFSSS